VSSKKANAEGSERLFRSRQYSNSQQKEKVNPCPKGEKLVEKKGAYHPVRGSSSVMRRISGGLISLKWK